MRIALIAGALALSFSLAVSAQTKPSDAPDGDPVTVFDANDTTMNAAIAEALRTLPLLLQNGFTTDGFGLPTVSLKVAMPAASGNGDEVIWVNGLTQTSAGYTGYLANAPVDLGTLRQGDQVNFVPAQINDWAIRSPDGRLYGHYTTRVIATIPGNEYLWDLLMPDPVPPEWQ